MTDFQSRTILVGVFPVISHSGAMGRNALGFGATEFVGRFTLPFEAEWGEMVLPAGDYTLVYRKMDEAISLVEIAGKDSANPRGIFVVEGQSRSSVVQNALVCVRKDGCRIIRSLELPVIGKAVSFAVSHATKSVHSQSAARFEARFGGSPN
jgi:hypothetical protein